MIHLTTNTKDTDVCHTVLEAMSRKIKQICFILAHIYKRDGDLCEKL